MTKGKKKQEKLKTWLHIKTEQQVNLKQSNRLVFFFLKKKDL